MNSTDWKRWKRAIDPAWAERDRQVSLAAKRRRKGVCEVCGGETKYHGRGINGPSLICADCSRRKQHEERRWTRETIIRALQRFEKEMGRPPAAIDTKGPSESIVIRLSGKRIRELEQVRELGLVLPSVAMVCREFGSWSAGLEAAGMPVSHGGTPTHRRLR